MSAKRAAKRRPSSGVKLSPSATKEVALAAYFGLCYAGVTGHGGPPPRQVVVKRVYNIPMKGRYALALAELTGRELAPKKRPARRKRAKARK